jgi:hypothetical protein
VNIFVLDYNPRKAAHYMCDKHVVKMPLETAQMLCTAFEVGTPPYKRTHYNHPCSVWCRESRHNFLWLIQHGLALCDEFNFRYKKEHKSREVILWCQQNINVLAFNSSNRTRFAMCFDEKYKIGNAVLSYREYYKNEKSEIAQWLKGRSAPAWF